MNRPNEKSLTVRVLTDLMREKRGMVIGFAVLVLAGVILSLLPPQILRMIIDENLAVHRKEGLQGLAVCYVLLLLTGGVADFGKAALMTSLGQKLIRMIRYQLAEKMGRLRPSYFTENSSGSITSRFTTDTENVSTLFTDGIVNLFADCFKIIGIVISIFLFQVRLGLIVLLLIPVIFGFTRLVQRRMQKAQIRNLEQLGDVNQHIVESITNVDTVKSYHREQWMEKRYTKLLHANFTTQNEVNFYDAVYSPIIQIIKGVVIVLIVMLTSDAYGALGISIGMVAASIELITNLFAPIESLGMELTNMQKGISGMKRLEEFYRTDEETKRDDSITMADLAESTVAARGAAIEFDHLSFTYDGSRYILQDFCRKIEAGDFVTFTGRTGVGKTTLFNLISGILEPTHGAVLINGYRVDQIPATVRRRLFGYVEQRFSEVSGTLMDQITLYDSSFTEEQVWEVLDFVGLKQEVEKLPKGLTSALSDCVFSQGQLQLLAIARAVVADPPVLLLDEITANLDSMTEQRIMEALERAADGRTVLSVSHRFQKNPKQAEEMPVLRGTEQRQKCYNICVDKIW